MGTPCANAAFLLLLLVAARWVCLIHDRLASYSVYEVDVETGKARDQGKGIAMICSFRKVHGEDLLELLGGQPRFEILLRRNLRYPQCGIEDIFFIPITSRRAAPYKPATTTATAAAVNIGSSLCNRTGAMIQGNEEDERKCTCAQVDPKIELPHRRLYHYYHKNVLGKTEGVQKL